ncbi:SusC/RagA family TonB-linked outer membrane protein [Proteiniphilum sp. UBA5384]|uniref:SusC/RagA family TonB-linked outer membrane protein n=1 Tax=Proteiniphilum sp. UBA5384 TaxID=1947279 RepID=UPI0025CBD204|nr:TonB-dependent receptor [Proteiniphilum sp. UBA5384]
MKRKILNITKGTILPLLLAFSFNTLAQNITVKGTVTDKDKEPLIGVSIKVRGTTTGTITDGKGQYTLPDISSNATLEVSYIGMLPEIIPVNSRTVINVAMVEDSKTLEEVVVIGYGEASRKDITGSVGSVKVEDLQKAPVRSFEEALAGRVAGVQVSSQDGQPGSAIDIVIRGPSSISGSNSPLFVIDDFIVEDPENNAINPSDIESIDVLKDASATAIYGSRGANGVIIITTKSGKEGKPVIVYDGYYGSQKITQRMELMGPYEYVKLVSERQSSMANSLFFQDGRTLDDYKQIEGIDWQDHIFRRAPIQDHNLSVRGGNKDTKYSFSASIFNQDGVLINSGYDRWQGRFRIDQQINKDFKLMLSINYSNLKRHGTSPGGNYNSALLWKAMAYRPVSGNPDVDLLELEFDEEIEDQVNNPRFNPVLTARNELRESINNTLSVNGYGEYTFGDFKLRASLGMRRDFRKNNSFNNSKTQSGSPRFPGAATNGVNGSVIQHELFDWMNENTLTYRKRIGGHNLTALGGFTVEGRDRSSFGASAFQVPNENLGVSGLDEGIPNVITSTSSNSKLTSFLSRVNYNYRGKYMLTASLRADGSSRFAPGNRWGWFPSGAISWRFSSEDFMKPYTFVSDAKLRASVGVTGNNRVSDFSYMSTIEIPISSPYPFNNKLQPSAIPSELGNEKLTWESTLQTNIGLDLSLFKDRITFTADIYEKLTRDLLLRADLPPSLGYSRTYKNIGKVSNKGLELSLYSMNIQSKDFSWSTNFNIAFNRNKVKQLTENQETLLSSVTFHSQYNTLPLYMAKVGEPIAMFYGLIWDGNYQFEDFDPTSTGGYILKPTVPTNGDTRESIRPGDIKYRDINGDGIVNLDDYTIIGNPNPKHIGGFTNNFTYKGFDLSVFFQWSYGNEIYNANRQILEGRGTTIANQYASYENRWTPENPTNKNFRSNGYGPYTHSSRVIEDASYLRLKTVSLGYTVPQRLTTMFKVNSIRVYMSGQNLYTWTNYSGFDPEVSARASSLTPGFDFSAYPRARTFTFGLNISL